MAVSKYFMYPGAQRALIEYGKSVIHSNAARKVRQDLVAVLRKRDDQAARDVRTALGDRS